jgi:hypothetical protein
MPRASERDRGGRHSRDGKKAQLRNRPHQGRESPRPDLRSRSQPPRVGQVPEKARSQLAQLNQGRVEQPRNHPRTQSGSAQNPVPSPGDGNRPTRGRTLVNRVNADSNRPGVIRPGENRGEGPSASRSLGRQGGPRSDDQRLNSAPLRGEKPRLTPTQSF